MRRLLPMLTLAAATLFGASQAEAVRILGRGADQCSVWLRVRTTPQAAEYREWFLGYLSASAYLKNRDVLRDQARRRYVDTALRQGRYTGWEYTPPREATGEYMRNHLDLNDVERNARWPR